MTEARVVGAEIPGAEIRLPGTSLQPNSTSVFLALSAVVYGDSALDFAQNVIALCVFGMLFAWYLHRISHGTTIFSKSREAPKRTIARSVSSSSFSSRATTSGDASESGLCVSDTCAAGLRGLFEVTQKKGGRVEARRWRKYSDLQGLHGTAFSFGGGGGGLSPPKRKAVRPSVSGGADEIIPTFFENSGTLSVSVLAFFPIVSALGPFRESLPRAHLLDVSCEQIGLRRCGIC